jgi:hypothetical protein
MEVTVNEVGTRDDMIVGISVLSGLPLNINIEVNKQHKVILLGDCTLSTSWDGSESTEASTTESRRSSAATG